MAIRQPPRHCSACRSPKPELGRVRAAPAFLARLQELLFWIGGVPEDHRFRAIRVMPEGIEVPPISRRSYQLLAAAFVVPRAVLNVTSLGPRALVHMSEALSAAAVALAYPVLHSAGT